MQVLCVKRMCLRYWNPGSGCSDARRRWRRDTRRRWGCTRRWRRARRWRWRQFHRGLRLLISAAVYGYLVTPRVHALDVAEVVALLQAVSGNLRGLRPCQSANQEPCARAHRSALLTADRCTGSCANCGADHRAAYPALRSGVAGRYAANAFKGIVSACHVVGAELVKALVGAGQGHHVGSTRHRGAGSDQPG